MIRLRKIRVEPPCTGHGPARHLLMLGALNVATAAVAQTVGPGTINAPVVTNTGTGNLTVVGNTSIAIPAAGSATNVTGATLTLDPNAAGFPPGPISLQSTTDHGLFANSSSTPAAIISRPGVSVSTLTFGTGAVALGSAASIDATGLTINNAASGSGGGYGAIAQTGGRITLTDSAITTTRTRAIALGSSGAGSSLIVQGTLGLTTNGAFSTGLYAQNGGTVSLPASVVMNLNGQGSTGLVFDATSPAGNAIGAGLTIHLNGTGETAANGGTGVALFSGSSATLQGLRIDGADAGTGVVAVAGDPRPLGAAFADTSSHAVLSDAVITISRAGGSAYSVAGAANGVLVNAAGNTTPVMNSVVSAAPAGLRATPGGSVSATATSTIDATSTTINMNAANGYGVYAGARVASGLNTINLTGSTVNTTGTNTYGLGADQNGLVTATQSRVNAAGGGGGLYLVTGTDVANGRGPTIQLTQTDVATAGDTAGMVSLNYSNTLVNRVTMSGGSMNAPASVGIYANGGPTEVSVDNAAVNGGDLLLQVQGSAFAPQATSVQLNASNGSALTGDATADASSTANIALRTASRWNGAALNITNVAVDPTSTWNVTGNSVLTQQLANAGLVAFTPPVGGAFKTLTAQNYVGSGGVIGLNTFLGADNSPSDKLIINGGTASGASSLRIINAGGPGALTLANGIKVVDTINGGTTQPNAFTLNGRAVEGVYEYRLFRGSVDGSNADAWYLRSARTPEPPKPPAPTPDPTPSVVPPLYRPEVGAYLANPRVAVGFLVHSLHDRLGEPQWTEQQTFEDDDPKRRSAWVRLVGRNSDSQTRDGNFDVSSKTCLLHAGGDVAQWSVFRGDDRLHLGGMVSYGSGSSDAWALGNIFHASSKTDGVTIGAYGTWFQNNETRLGWYTDLWGQYGWFNNHVDGDALPSVGYDSRFLALSAETGYAWLPGKTRDWVIEPQAQIIWVDGRQDGIIESNGTQIGGADGNGWISRLGVRTHRTWISDSGNRTQLYLTLNWWHDAASSQMAFNTVQMRDLYPKDRYEIKLGADLQRGKGWTAWGNVGWEWGNQSYRAFTGRVGVKRTW